MAAAVRSLRSSGPPSQGSPGALSFLDTPGSESLSRNQRASSDPAAEPLRSATLSSFFGISSKLDYEPNPFEQSFSEDKKPAVAGPSSRRARSNSPFGGFARTPGGTAVSGTANGGAQANGAGSKLPPVSTLTSPTGAALSQPPLPPHMNWHGLDGNSSLRSGPLSPAMLSGPAPPTGGSLFDPSNLRTGLTPLPLTTGGPQAGYVPPSPNTAALFAMMTNESPGAKALGQRFDGPNHFDASFGKAEAKSATEARNNGFATQGLPKPLSMDQRSKIGISSSIGAATMPAIAPSVVAPARLGRTQPIHPQSIPPQQYAAQNPLYMFATAAQEIGGTGHDDGAVMAANALSGLAAFGHQPNGHPLPPPPPQQLQPPPQPAPTRGAKSGKAPAAAPASRKRKSDPADVGVAPPPKRAAARSAAKRKNDDYESDSDPDHEPDGKPAKGGRGRASNKNETEEEKRRNFLERNRQAALKCRQRKKQWLQQLQAKVEYLGADNDALQSTVKALRDEVSSLRAVLASHRDCGVMGSMPPATNLNIPRPTPAQFGVPDE